MNKNSEAYQYKLQRSRIKRYVDRWEKKGVYFGEDVYSIFHNRYSAEALKEYTKERIFQNAYMIDPETGEELPVMLKGRKLQYKPIIDMSAQIIQNWLDLLARSVRGEGYAVLMRYMDNLRSTRTDQQISQMIQRAAAKGVILSERIVYHEQQALRYIAETMNTLEDIGRAEKIEIYEALDVYDYEGYLE